MDFQKRKITELKHADYNPRKALKPGDAEYEKIKRSIQEFGYVDPIIINADNTIIGGHQRATVLADLGIAEIDVVVVDLPKDKEKALNIALNKISGEWDEYKLNELLQDLMAQDVDTEITGFDIDEIQELMLQFADEPQDDEFNADEELEQIDEPTTKQGDIWQLGEHRLICGDSLKPETYQKLMGDERADLVVTDPPYNVDYEGVAGKIQNDNMSSSQFIDFLSNAFKQTTNFMRAGGQFMFFTQAVRDMSLQRRSTRVVCC